MKESYPIPSYYGFPYIPWFFQMYQVVKTFTEQGVERNIDVAGSTVSWKFNKWDFIGDVLHQESC